VTRKIAYWTDQMVSIDPAGQTRSIPVRRCAWIQRIDGDICLIAMSPQLDPYCAPEDEGSVIALSYGVWSLTP
jgi:hypothetical protein